MGTFWAQAKEGVIIHVSRLSANDFFCRQRQRHFPWDVSVITMMKNLITPEITNRT